MMKGYEKGGMADKMCLNFEKDIPNYNTFIRFS